MGPCFFISYNSLILISMVTREALFSDEHIRLSGSDNHRQGEGGA